MLMMNNNLTTEQRLSKAVVAIMSNPRYMALSGVMMIGERSVVDNIPTACTNGRDEMYGRAFVDSLNDAELRFLVLHEVYHKLYQHLHTWRHLYDEHPQLANMACDYVINHKLVSENSDGFATMTGSLKVGCYDSKYAEWDSARVYNDLKDEVEKNGGSSEFGESGEGFDEHDWEGAEKLTAEEKHALARDIDEAIRQGALMAGKTGADVSRDMKDLMEPQINWREALREFIQNTCAGSDYSTWSKPNRRYIGAGMYMPSGISEQIGELVIAIDTSGSIGDVQLADFLSEVKGIADTVHPEAVRLLYWGHEVVGDERYETHELDTLVQSTKPRGGGGTDVTCVSDYLTAEGINPQAIVVLTDGYLYGGWGSWSAPVLWTILDNKSAQPDCGKTVHINGRDM
jgi:predicted metal-dependent peptidase